MIKDQTFSLLELFFVKLLPGSKQIRIFLPRTQNFGVDYLDFSQLVHPDCPSDFLKVAYSCVAIDQEMRPTCEEIRRSFKAILKSLRPIMLKSIEVQKLTEKLS